MSAKRQSTFGNKGKQTQPEFLRSEPYRLPNRKAKKSHIEVSGRSHAERSVEWMNAVPDPEGHAGENKDNSCGRDKPHLSGGRVNAESRRCNKKQNELLQCIVNDPAINLHRHVLLLQCWINGVAEKASVSHHQNAKQERNYSKGVGLNGVS